MQDVPSAPVALLVCILADSSYRQECKTNPAGCKGEPAWLQLFVLREHIEYYPLERSVLFCFASLIPRRSMGMQKGHVLSWE